MISRQAGKPFLHRLPTEILVEIMKWSPDLSSLFSLISTSSTLASVFDLAAGEIVEAVLSSTVPDSIRALMRAVIQIRTSSLELLTLDEAMLFFKEDYLVLNTNRIPRKTLPVTLRKFLRLAHHIHALSHSCLDYYIQQCLSMQPSHLADPNFRYPSFGRIWAAKPPGQKYQVKATANASWVEEQRVIKNLWRVQLFLEFKAALSNGGQICWSSSERDRLKAMAVMDFYCKMHHFEATQILTVLDFLEKAKGYNQGKNSGFQLPTADFGDGNFHASCPPWPEPKLFGCDEYDQGETKLDCSSLGYRVQRMMASDYRSPLRYSAFDPYRKFGIAIWDTARLMDLQLVDSSHKGEWVIEPNSIFFTWRSLLTQDEDAEVLRCQVARRY